MAWSARKFFGSLADKLKRPKPIMTLLPNTSNRVLFIVGPTKASSSWLSSYAYVYYEGDYGILIQFNSGATCFYPGTTSRQYNDLDSEDSKGSWTYENLYEHEYKLI